MATVDVDQSSAEVEHRPRTDVPVFAVAAGLALAFLLYGAIDSEGFAKTGGSILGWITGNFGWFFVLSSGAFVVFSMFLAFTRYGNIKLGPDEMEPEFSTFSWVSMMFATGMGIGLMFYGVAEPLTHLNTPPMGLAEPGSDKAAHLAMEYTFFHWGFHPWAMYAVIGLAIAYFAYRKGRGNLISAAFYPLLGKRVEGPAGKTIDILAILATLFGSATSLGLGALQITGGLANVFGRQPYGKVAAAVVIAVLTACFVLSAVSGVDKGIKWLSNANAIAAALLVFFIFVVGPTVFILGTFTESIGGYLTQLPAMSFRTGVFGGADWLSGWTIFYWAWWMSWAPFVGTFMARISRGRTIREFVVCVLIVPTIVSTVWFVVMGGTAIDFQLNGVTDMAASLDSGVENTLFTLLDAMPASTLTALVVVVLIMLFYVAGADSAALVLGMFNQGGSLQPKTWLVVLWGSMIGAVAIALLLAGGLSAIQTTVIVFGVPFLAVIMWISFNLIKQLRAEPVTTTVPPGVRTLLVESLHEPAVASRPTDVR